MAVWVGGRLGGWSFGWVVIWVGGRLMVGGWLVDGWVVYTNLSFHLSHRAIEQLYRTAITLAKLLFNS